MSEIKQTFGQVRAFKDDVEKTRTIEFVISTATKDRHGTVLNMGNWELENFNRNGISGYQHNVYGGDMCNAPNPDDVIGPARAWIEGEELIGSITFENKDINPLAEKLFRKVLNGTLKATSVGFKPLKNEDGEIGQNGRKEGEKTVDKDTFFYFGQELLEFSIVNIPSNPDALKRSLSDQAANAIMYIKRTLGNDFSFTDIEALTVRNVIDLLNGKKPEAEPDPVDDTEKIKIERSLKLQKQSLAL